MLASARAGGWLSIRSFSPSNSSDQLAGEKDMSCNSSRPQRHTNWPLLCLIYNRLHVLKSDEGILEAVVANGPEHPNIFDS